MYLRPGSIFRDFIVERKMTTTNEIGRKRSEFKPTGGVIIGVLSDAKTSEIQRWKELQHPITHTIVQKNGKIMAKEGDRLIRDGRYFFVQGVDDASMLGAFILYYVEERRDTVDT